MTDENIQRSYSELQGYVAELRERGLHNGHRYLVLLTGERQYADELVARLCCEAAENTLTLSRNTTFSSGLPAKHYLGREYTTLIIDAWTELSVNNWLAAAGTLRAGGILFLSCPDIELWPSYYAEQHGYALPSQLIRRFAAIAADSPAVKIWPQHKSAAQHMPATTVPWSQQLPSADQLTAIAGVKRVVTGRAKRPLVIRADRGRGKTALLGIAAAELFTEDLCKRILIVANSKLAIAPALLQLEQHFAGGQWQDNAYLNRDCRFQIFTMEQALDCQEHWDAVFVDEAASYSVAMLRDVVLSSPRLVLATTVHGYEGSGRGFDTRFKATLDQLRPQWRRQYLDAPIRWQADDPLEAFLNHAFLLDTEIPALDDDGAPPLVEELDKTELASDEPRLRQVFALLVQAHYQTTPQDLQQLLDGSSRVLAATVNGQVIAVCLLFPEGGIDRQTAVDISAGQRRPKGSMVAQGLSQLSGDGRFCESTSLRVSRIAVLAPWRRRGVGRQLIAAAEQMVKTEGIDFLSSSFALENDALDFWRALDFVPLALGSRIDPASGGYSLIIAKSSHAGLQRSFEQLRQQLQRDLPYSVRSTHRSLNPMLLLALLTENTVFEVTHSDAVVTSRYLAGAVSIEQAAAALARLCLACAEQAEGDALSLGMLVYGKDWPDIAGNYNLAGRAECEMALRQYIQLVYEKFIQEPTL